MVFALGAYVFGEFCSTIQFFAKVQLINPRKVYAIDTGLLCCISGNMTDDLKRELNGLTRALEFFSIENARIVTYNTTDLIQVNNLRVEVLSA